MTPARAGGGLAAGVLLGFASALMMGSGPIFPPSGGGGGGASMAVRVPATDVAFGNPDGGGVVGNNALQTDGLGNLSATNAADFSFGLGGFPGGYPSAQFSAAPGLASLSATADYPDGGCPDRPTDGGPCPYDSTQFSVLAPGHEGELGIPGQYLFVYPTGGDAGVVMEGFNETTSLPDFESYENGNWYFRGVVTADGGLNTGGLINFYGGTGVDVGMTFYSTDSSLSPLNGSFNGVEGTYDGYPWTPARVDSAHGNLAFIYNVVNAGSLWIANSSSSIVGRFLPTGELCVSRAGSCGSGFSDDGSSFHSIGSATITGGVDKLTDATGTVSVAAATAPSSGQVLTATSSTVATWQTPTAITATRQATAGGTSLLTAVSVGQEIGARASAPLTGNVAGVCCQVEVVGSVTGNFTVSVIDITDSATATGQSRACNTAIGTKWCDWVSDGGMSAQATTAGALFVPDFSATNCSVSSPELSCNAMVTY